MIPIELVARLRDRAREVRLRAVELGDQLLLVGDLPLERALLRLRVGQLVGLDRCRGVAAGAANSPTRRGIERIARRRWDLRPGRDRGKCWAVAWRVNEQASSSRASVVESGATAGYGAREQVHARRIWHRLRGTPETTGSRLPGSVPARATRSAERDPCSGSGRREASPLFAVRCRAPSLTRRRTRRRSTGQSRRIDSATPAVGGIGHGTAGELLIAKIAHSAPMIRNGPNGMNVLSVIRRATSSTTITDAGEQRAVDHARRTAGTGPASRPTETSSLRSPWPIAPAPNGIDTQEQDPGHDDREHDRERQLVERDQRVEAGDVEHQRDGDRGQRELVGQQPLVEVRGQQQDEGDRVGAEDQGRRPAPGSAA